MGAAHVRDCTQHSAAYIRTDGAAQHTDGVLSLRSQTHPFRPRRPGTTSLSSRVRMRRRTVASGSCGATAISTPSRSWPAANRRRRTRTTAPIPSRPSCRSRATIRTLFRSRWTSALTTRRPRRPQQHVRLPHRCPRRRPRRLSSCRRQRRHSRRRPRRTLAVLTTRQVNASGMDFTFTQ